MEHLDEPAGDGPLLTVRGLVIVVLACTAGWFVKEHYGWLEGIGTLLTVATGLNSLTSSARSGRHRADR